MVRVQGTRLYILGGVSVEIQEEAVSLYEAVHPGGLTRAHFGQMTEAASQGWNPSLLPARPTE